MNYVFLDTNVWIDFAKGRKGDSMKTSPDFTDNNHRILKDLIALIDSNQIVLLKNEIIDLEFNEATIDELADAYEKSIIEQFKSILETKVIPHCQNLQLRDTLNRTMLDVDEIIAPFKERCYKFNEQVFRLYDTSRQINVSERLKQKVLQHSIKKDHPLFLSRQNNVNDFLILYSLQEWVENNDELKYLDETSYEHSVFFVTKNIKDFGISNKAFSDDLLVSGLIKPIVNLDELVTSVKIRSNDFEGSADFLPAESLSEASFEGGMSPIDMIVDKLHELIALKQEWMRSFVRAKLSEQRASSITKLKYICTYVAPNGESVKANELVVRSQNIREFRIIKEDLIHYRPERFFGSMIRSEKGDVLVNSYGVNAGEHAINRLDKDVLVHVSIYVLRPDQAKVDVNFLDYCLKTYDLSDYSTGSVIPKLNLKDLMNFELSLPQVKEQMSLLELFAEKEKEIEGDIQKIKQKIKMLLS